MEYSKFALNSFNQNSIVKNCDEGFASGVMEFGYELFANAPNVSHSFLSRKYSMQSLIFKHLVKPLETALDAYHADRHREIFEDFSLSKIGNYFDSRTDLTKHQRINYSLDHWSREMHKFARAEDLRLNPSTALVDFEFIGLEPLNSSQKRFYATLDTLKLVIEDLRAFKPQVSTIPSSSLTLFDPVKTTQYSPEDALDTCCLCWRNTQRYNVRNKINHRDVSIASNKFCDKHALQGLGKLSPNWSRYIRARRYLERYQAELENLWLRNSNTDRTRFLIDIVSLKALIEKKQRYPLCPVGDRAMAYYLVRSGLDNAGYRRVYNAKYTERLSNIEIAEKLGISRQAVSKSLKKISSKLYDVMLKTQQAVKA